MSEMQYNILIILLQLDNNMPCLLFINFFIYYRSGVEEDYTEKMHLLEEIRGLMETAKSEKNEKLESESQSEQNIKEQAKVIRDAALSTFKRGRNCEKVSNTITYMFPALF